MSGAEARYFLDTNVLVYAHDRSAGVKYEHAQALLRERWEQGDGCLSLQVLQEFYVTITQKVPHPLAQAAAAEIVTDLATWVIHSPTPNDLLDALRLQRRYQLAFWDAMILNSATVLGCREVWSEDMNDGQQYGGVRVVNPFR
jgi:predicted nucleic acid-binding protein